jgi:hypothetical protein
MATKLPSRWINSCIFFLAVNVPSRFFDTIYEEFKIIVGMRH